MTHSHAASGVLLHAGMIQLSLGDTTAGRADLATTGSQLHISTRLAPPPGPR